MALLLLEHLLWFGKGGRSFLFWSFVCISTLLFTRLIVYPLLTLFRIRKGLKDSEAASLIGRHFPEVGDKLVNLLQLSRSREKTELLLASIEQKAVEIRPVPFSRAVDLKKSLLFLRYLLIPLGIFLLFFLIGRIDVFSESYGRVLHYRSEFDPPAPFRFRLDRDDLVVLENQELHLRIITEGNVIPETASILIGEQEYFLVKESPGIFSYRTGNVTEPFRFRLRSNGITSEAYEVKVIPVPVIQNFRMVVVPPGYTGILPDTIEGTGNAKIPMGSLVHWDLETEKTSSMDLRTQDTIFNLTRNGSRFGITRKLFSDFSYEISSSNEAIRDYEKLQYEIRVMEDRYPQLNVEFKKDSLREAVYFRGLASDDYGITAVDLVYYPEGQSNEVHRERLQGSGGVLSEVLGVFPDSIAVKEGVPYVIFLEAWDNDRVSGPKKKRSDSFTFRKDTAEEEIKKNLEAQRTAAEALGKAIDQLEQTEDDIRDLERQGLQKKGLDYRDRKAIQNLLERQRQQDRILEQFNQQMERTLQEDSQEPDLLRNAVKERLREREKDLEENEKLLEELEEFTEKLKEEGLTEKLEEMARKTAAQERNLKLLLELTKKFYVQQKLSRLTDKLDELGSRQEELSEMEDTVKEQDSLNRETQQAFDELRELGIENGKLEEPLDMEERNEEMESIRDHQERAQRELEKEEQDSGQEEQEKAGKKLREMAADMERSLKMSAAMRMQEDVEMLRRILDNLVVFSFSQEDLMSKFEGGAEGTSFVKNLKEQDVLKENFQHIDDSLYALAVRNPMISEEVIDKVSGVEYNLEQALKRFSSNEVRSGIGSQQYVIKGSNDLALLLSGILGNMEQMLNSGTAGQGDQSGEKQLQDIIMEQRDLGDQMEKGVEQREKSGSGEKEGSDGDLYRIFQEQQMLRKALEDALEDTPGQGKELTKEMEEIEQELLENGFDPQTLKRMRDLEHKLLEFEEAEILQESGERRKATTGKDQFSNPTEYLDREPTEYFEKTELLNRQSLPLRSIFREKVREYFENDEN